MTAAIVFNLIAGLALIVSGVALAVTLLRGRRAEFVATRDESNETKLLEHTYAIRNVGAAPARNVEVRFDSRGENITDEHYSDDDVVRIPAIAPLHKLPIASVVYTFGETAADTVNVSWTDLRRKRQELQTSLLPLPTAED